MQHHPTSPLSTGDPVPRVLRHWLQDLRTCFTAPSWEHVLVLVMGAVLAPGKCTVSACLRMTGRIEATNFSSYHQILNRARWDSHTFAETRAHLGVETQRQWSDKAIARTTPALFGLYSLISLWACDLLNSSTAPYAAAWYRKTSLTFSDAIGAVRLTLWVGDIFQHSPPDRKHQKIPPDRIVRMAEALCFAA